MWCFTVDSVVVSEAGCSKNSVRSALPLRLGGQPLRLGCSGTVDSVVYTRARNCCTMIPAGVSFSINAKGVAVDLLSECRPY